MNKEQIIEAIESMTVLELSELVKLTFRYHICIYK